jgi:hypothetical protein
MPRLRQIDAPSHSSNLAVASKWASTWFHILTARFFGALHRLPPQVVLWPWWWRVGLALSVSERWSLKATLHVKHTTLVRCGVRLTAHPPTGRRSGPRPRHARRIPLLPLQSLVRLCQVDHDSACGLADCT